MIEFSFDPSNGSIRKEWIDGEWYYSIIDFVSVFHDIDHFSAQNCYHVLKNHLNKSKRYIPNTTKLKASSFDGKLRFTDFTNLEGLQMLQRLLEVNRYHRNQRNNQSKQYEVEIFHPIVITALQAKGWQTLHHVRVPSGKTIDIIAEFEKRIYVIECKPFLSEGSFYAAIGQVLCYCQEYNVSALPAIAAYQNEFNGYAKKCCIGLGVEMIEIPLEQNYDSRFREQRENS